MKKFVLTSEFVTTICGTKLFRIKATASFGNVSEGDFGGYIESEKNLEQSGNAWVYGDARVYGDAQVSGDAQASGNAWVYGNACVSGNAQVSGDAWVYGDARVYGDAWVYGDARVSGDAWVYGDARVSGNADYACVKGFGRHARNTTFFRTKDGGVTVSCGCFTGSISEFREKVKTTHGDSKMGREYLMIADLMELHFGEDEA